VRDGSTDWGWGVVVNVVKKPPASGTLPPALSASRSNNYTVDTLLHCSSNSSENGSRSKPCPPRPGEKGEMHVVSSELKLYDNGFYHVRLSLDGHLRYSFEINLEVFTGACTIAFSIWSKQC
jgi:ATP-dependent RNA helicase DOB1